RHPRTTLLPYTTLFRSMQNPKAKSLEKVSDALIFTKSHPTVKVGGATFTRCNIPLRYQDQNIISISRDGDHFFLNGMFWDSKGRSEEHTSELQSRENLV